MSSYSELDWGEVLNKIGGYATSGTAKNALKDISPLQNKDLAIQSFDDLECAIQLLLTGVRPFMESLDLYEVWITRLKKKAVLKILEIKDLRSFCLEVMALREALQQSPSAWSKTSLGHLMTAVEPISAVDQIMTARGEIRADASEKLHRLYREKENLTRQISDSLDKLVNDQQMTSYLQDKFVTTREGRWVLPIRGGSQHYVPGVIHASSQTKQTVFIEPDVVIPLNNRLRQVEVEIEEEIERLLFELSQYLWGLTSDFVRTRDTMLNIDCVLARAQFSKEISGMRCQFLDQQIFLPDLRHPVMVLSGKPVVSNTVRLTSLERILLLSGPNAGGKTVLLKSIGLAAHMARCGLLIPASDGAIVPFFHQIHIVIGDSQSVEEDLSTFAAHVKLLSKAAELSGNENLILVDEICGSTDPEEGSALARSFIEKFSSQLSFAVITSHLGPLKTGWQGVEGIINGSLEYDVERDRPTYQFLQGVAGESLALQTAKRAGVSASVIARAIELLSPASRARLSKLEELESLKSDLQTLRDHLHKETQKAKNEKEKFAQMQASLEREKDAVLEKLKKDTEKRIQEMISASQAEQTFKRHSQLQEIKLALPEIIKAKPGSTKGIETKEEFARAFPPGSKVFVPSLGQDGLIQSEPNAKGEVFVLSGAVRLNLPWQDLKLAQKNINPTADLVRKSKTMTVAFQDAERSLDLRGKTVDEALSDLEIELDHAVALREDRLKIIHGHGTEALKKAVRTSLSRSVYVKKWRSGSPEQGGDGVTWVELNID